MALPEYKKSLQFEPSQMASPEGTNLLYLPPSQANKKWDSRLVRQIIFAGVFLLSALYTAQELKRGWFPWDEGIFARSAEAALHGKLAHRDFVEIYTGGLTYLNAASFKLFGTNLASMRYMLYLFFLLWVPAFYGATRRFVQAPAAAAVTLLAVAWSVPAWPAPMPSWYNLFFATFGLVALLRYIETQHRRWLFVAGLCGGLSCVIKVSGLFFIASALLFLLFRELVFPRSTQPGRRENGLYRLFLTVNVVLYELLVFLLLSKVSNVVTFPFFWLPNVAVGAAILWLEFRRDQSKGGRFAFLFQELTLFAAGVVIPVAIFLVPYILTGSVNQIFGGVSGSISGHLQSVTSKPPVLKFAIGIPVNFLLGAAFFLTRSRAAKVVAGTFVSAGMALVLLLVPSHMLLDRAVWGTIWSFLPVVVVAGAVLLILWSVRRRLDVTEQQKVFLVLSVCATTSLLQFPFTAASYFCHVAPFAFLSAAALASRLQSPPRWAIVACLCFCLLYVTLEVTPGFVTKMGQQYFPDRQIAKLDMPRGGGLRVEPASAQAYHELGVIIKEHSRSDYVLAVPSCEEVYFLYNLRDPLATLFHTPVDPSRATETVLGLLRQHDVNVVVLNNLSIFGSALPLDLRSALEREYPNRSDAGWFQVRWKS